VVRGGGVHGLDAALRGQGLRPPTPINYVFTKIIVKAILEEVKIS